MRRPPQLRARATQPSASHLDPVFEAAIHVLRQVAPTMPPEANEEVARRISARAKQQRDLTFQMALGTIDAIGRATPATFQELARGTDGSIDLAAAVSLMALTGQRTEARWLDALAAAAQAREVLEQLLAAGAASSADHVLAAGTALERIRALAPEPPPALDEAGSPEAEPMGGGHD